MRTPIMMPAAPAPRRVRVDMPLDADLLARLVPVTDPELYTGRPGESATERAAREAAAADITDALLAEQAALVVDELHQEVGL